MAMMVGMMIGLVLGLTGAGGSVFAVPLLMLFLGLPVQTAIGLSLGAVAVTTLFGSVAKITSRDIQWLPALVYASVGSFAAPVGTWINRQMDERLLMFGFSVLVLIIAARMWVQARNAPQQTTVVRSGISEPTEEGGAICRINNGQTFRIGLPCVLGISSGAIATGLLSGMFGVGGGFLAVPTLLFLTGISIKQAVATSLVVIAAISMSGFVSFVAAGSSVNYGLLGLVASGGLLGMTLGLFTSKRLAGPLLQKIFVVLMVVMAVITIGTQF